MRHIHCHIDDDYFGAVTGIPVVRFFSSYERGIWAAMMDACHHQSVVFYFSNVNCADFSTNQVKKTFRCRRAITNCLVTNCFLHGNSSRPYFELNDRLPATQISVVTHFHTTRRWHHCLCHTLPNIRRRHTIKKTYHKKSRENKINCQLIKINGTLNMFYYRVIYLFIKSLVFIRFLLLILFFFFCMFRVKYTVEYISHWHIFTSHVVYDVWVLNGFFLSPIFLFLRAVKNYLEICRFHPIPSTMFVCHMPGVY